MDEDVAAGAAVEDVDPEAADQHVVTCTAEQSVDAVAADEHIIAVTAVGRELDAAGGKA